MRVVQYSHVPSGGHWEYAYELAAAIGRTTSESFILSPNPGIGIDTENVTALGGITPTDSTRRGAARLLNRLNVYLRHPAEAVEALKGLGIGAGDVVHVQSLPSLNAQYFTRQIKRLGCSVVITVHNTSPHATKDPFARIKQRLHRRAWDEFDAIIVHSLGQRAGLVRQGLDSNAIRVVPHPVWRRERSPSMPNRDYLLFGSLRENKGIPEFMAALVELGDPPATIAGHGSSKYIAEILRLKGDLGLTNLVVKAGFIAHGDLPELFATHAVNVLPYQQFEAQSGVLNLAIAFNRPSVVSDVGAMPELLGHFNIGEVYRQNLAESMIRVRTAAAAGQYEHPLSHARSALSIDKIARQTLDAYPK